MEKIWALILWPVVLVVMVSAAYAPDGPADTDDFDPLLQELCDHETQASVRPEYAVSYHESAWGICQVKYWSAVQYGGFDDQMKNTGVPSRSPADLFDPVVNMKIAGKILDLCRDLYGTRSTRRLIYCYGAGPHSKAYQNNEHRIWSKKIASDHADKQKRLAFQQLKR